MDNEYDCEDYRALEGSLSGVHLSNMTVEMVRSETPTFTKYKTRR